MSTAATSTAHAEEAKAYLDKHRIPWVMQQLLTVILHQKPADPRALMIKKLEEIKLAKTRGQSMVLFTRENLVALFKIFDVVGKGFITMEQYESAMKDIGATNYNPFPAGVEGNRIQQDTFVDNA
ncbi:EF-hand calcium-binding domain-containing protein 10 [Dinochytrium kinnereticum]|nr:EF-hand calcium-binding domain-containing protein 10 [Dinochytrium kinnereticum]